MNLDDLTPELIETALKALRQAQPLPPALLELHLVQSCHCRSVAEQELALAQHLHTLVNTALREQRQLAEVALSSPPTVTRQTLLAALAADFQQDVAALEAWSALYYRYLAPLEIGVDALARAAGVVSQQFRRRVAQGMVYLADALRRAELAAQPRDAAGKHLPPPDYARLFGLEEHLVVLQRWLTAPDAPAFLSLEGLGGIGKTALARAVAQQQVQQHDFQEVLWVSARQEWFAETGALIPLAEPARSLDDIVTRLVRQLDLPTLAGAPLADKLAALQRRLTQTPYLVIIDNLETAEDIRTLLPALHPLAGATRFLLTSRQSLKDFPYVAVYPVPELSRAASCALLAHELRRRGEQGDFPPELPDRLYALIGGLPLALKLVAAQIGSLPLETILADLQSARQSVYTGLYSYIYRRTWELLPPSARHLLLSLLVADPDGEDVDFIYTLSALPWDDFVGALEALRRFSLLEAGHALAAPRYRLHRLTITFLETDVLERWQEPCVASNAMCFPTTTQRASR